jgi:uncharacterized RDD family membrane protein YckC
MVEKYCSSCSTKLMETMRMCPSCGAKVFSSTIPVAANQQPSAQSNTANPQSQASASSHTSLRFIPAGYWRRIGAALIDSVIVTVLSGIPIGIALLFTASKRDGTGFDIISVIMILTSVILPYCYFTVLHSSARRATYGKTAMGLILVTAQGETLTKMQAFLRVILTALIPVSGLILFGLSTAGIAMQYKDDVQPSLIIAIFIGVLAIYIGPFATVFFNTQRQTLFDLICKTYVIKK